MSSSRGRAGRIRRLMGIERSVEHHPQLVQVESNIEEWPIFQLGRSKASSVVAERELKGEDGSSMRQRMEVSAPGKYRLPGRFDYDVYSAVLELLEIRGGMPEDGVLRFSIHEIILIMDLEPSGRTYEEVKRSLRRIAATVLESDSAFWSSGQQRHISDTFRLWDVALDAVTDRNGSGSRHQIEFGKLFRRSFEEQYLRGLDIDFFWELDSPVAKRLYRLVDLKRSGEASWKTDLFDLQKYIPIGPYAYVSKVKEKLGAAHKELIAKGFLSGVFYSGRSGVAYEVAEAFHSHQESLELAGTKEELIAIQLLTRSGLRGDVARDLVAKHGPPHCTRYANSLPYQNNLRNPAGWLRKAIEDGYELDDPYHTDLPVLTASARKEPAEKTQGGRKPTSTPQADPAAQELWDTVLEDLVEGSDAPSLRVWFTGAVATSLDGEALTLAVPNDIAKEHIGGRFKEGIERLLKERLSDRARLRLEVSSPTFDG